MAPPPAGETERITQPKDPPKVLTTSTASNSKKSAAEIVAGPPTTNKSMSSSVLARHTMHNGKPAIIFKALDYYGVMAQDCKWTLVGKFTMGRPRIEAIISKFLEQQPLVGKVRIGAYDYRHVFIEFNNEVDFNTVYFKRFMSIVGSLMRLFKWSPDFDPNEETSLAPIWVLLPDLPFHCFRWEYLKQILSIVGTPLKEDLATIARSRPNMAKVRVEVDLMNPLRDSVWIGLEGEGVGLKGRDQKLKYKGVPTFCKSCRMQGHDQDSCKVMARRKEQEGHREENNTNSVIIGKNTLKESNDNEKMCSTSNNVEEIMHDKEGNKEDGFTQVINRRDKKGKGKQQENTSTGNMGKEQRKDMQNSIITGKQKGDNKLMQRPDLKKGENETNDITNKQIPKLGNANRENIIKERKNDNNKD
ncbi:hypothetical protein KY290_003412 [Solanum tuberosum]|uniref:DUF4283 domain-containing protein n=1 Tax=Solanum tuberosum TaxID=4113 RepID=A0ABQ7WSU4_SOLTU|nr:hypothetical protein KY284_003573 [Solanum tuberosum]KAH0767539.1 hypothetical protein KY285_003410 [Solanum tuberosum]KAH0783814.1 hypothetical protein KY290_003412 [Solanum tuberosum]